MAKHTHFLGKDVVNVLCNMDFDGQRGYRER